MSDTAPGSDRSERPRSHLVLAAVFGLSGVLHILKPAIFEQIVPPWFPAPRATVYVSGLAELVCASGLVTQRKWAPGASAALLVAVFPANIYMAIEYNTDEARSAAERVATIVRLPLQPLMIFMALRRKR